MHHESLHHSIIFQQHTIKYTQPSLTNTPLIPHFPYPSHPIIIINPPTLLPHLNPLLVSLLPPLSHSFITSPSQISSLPSTIPDQLIQFHSLSNLLLFTHHYSSPYFFISCTTSTIHSSSPSYLQTHSPSPSNDLCFPSINSLSLLPSPSHPLNQSSNYSPSSLHTLHLFFISNHPCSSSSPFNNHELFYHYLSCSSTINSYPLSPSNPLSIPQLSNHPRILFLILFSLNPFHTSP